MRTELETAVEAAVAAGEVLRENFGGRQNVTYKGEVDLVTEVDGEAERVVLEVLRRVFPNYGVLAEEGGEIPGESELRWIVDPLDGTTNYAHGFPAFAVSIALERAGEVLIGVVHDPISGETYVAERGGGATLNGRTLRVSGTEELLRSLLATGFPYDRSDMPEALELFGRFSKLTQGMRRVGAAALDLCYVAAGRLDGYYESGVKAWDIAAGSLILEEAGGRVTGYGGGELDLQSEELVATNGPLHPALLEVIRASPGPP
ncbi:MAG: inositol monophosphatase [Rubrobacter sp.]|nr:inositol monophosphatase [Rubrobacter sp.]